MIVTTKKIVCIFMKRIESRPWMFQAKTMPSMPITPEGHKSRNSERVLSKTSGVSETLGQIRTQWHHVMSQPTLRRRDVNGEITVKSVTKTVRQLRIIVITRVLHKMINRDLVRRQEMFLT